jgi:hypothetical protein
MWATLKDLNETDELLHNNKSGCEINSHSPRYKKKPFTAPLTKSCPNDASSLFSLLILRS